jgi:hypothetical protein
VCAEGGMMWRVLGWELQRHVWMTGGDGAQAVNGLQYQGISRVPQAAMPACKMRCVSGHSMLLSPCTTCSGQQRMIMGHAADGVVLSTSSCCAHLREQVAGLQLGEVLVPLHAHGACSVAQPFRGLACYRRTASAGTLHRHHKPGASHDR